MSNAFLRVRLREVVVPAGRAVTPMPGTLYRQIGVRLWGEGAYERETIDGAATKYATLFEARAGDLIVNKIWARNGSVAVVDASLSGCVGSGEFPMFSPRANLDPRWAHWLTKWRPFWEQCAEKSQGTSGQNRIKPERFLEVEIPLPPLPEQQHIVARIDEIAGLQARASSLGAECQKTTDALSYAGLRAMRLSLLASRFNRAAIGETFRVTAGGTPSRDNPAFWDGSIPWIKTGELYDGEVFSAEEHITETGVNGSSAKVFPEETVLVALYGQGQTRGRTGRLRVPAATNQACCAILPAPHVAISRYVQYWLRSWYHELREESQGGAQPNWNSGMIKALPIVLPPLPEQHRIVAKLDALQAEVDALKKAQAQTRAELDALFPAILDRAFAGAL